MPRLLVPSSLLSLFLTLPTIAGTLTPPVGPVAPTLKTIQETEPRTIINSTNTPGDADSVFRIATSGSYYLIGNVAGLAAKSGIEIAASGVRIDLMGFELAGVPGSLDGITCLGVAQTGLSIRNGLVRNFAGDGVDLASSETVTLVEVMCRANGGAGFRIGNDAVLSACHSTGNTLVGFVSNESCNFNGCVAYANGQQGFAPVSVGSGSFTGCAAEMNGSVGFHGFGAYCFQDCVARDNSGGGFFVGQQGASISNCHSINNNGDGFFNLVGSVVDSVSRGNAGDGIKLGSGTVSGCTSELSGGHGVVIQSAGLAKGNGCSGNGTTAATAAGVRVDNSDVRVEGNNCSGNDRGIDVGSAGNVIVGNTCSGNTINFVIVANNIYGPIIDRAAPASAAVSGSVAAGTMGSSDPNANYSY